MIYVSNTEGINLIECAATTIMKTAKYDSSSFSANKLNLYKSGVLITDTNRVNVITPLINIGKFLKYVGSLCKAFSTHYKGDRYELQTFKDAANIVNNFESYLEALNQNMRSKVDKKLPKHLNGPAGSVAVL